MKLKDRFDNAIMRHDLGRNEIEETKEQCAEIAENYVKEFLDWYKKISPILDKKYIGKSSKELLEIYKNQL
jgi:hypothetical protein